MPRSIMERTILPRSSRRDHNDDVRVGGGDLLHFRIEIGLLRTIDDIRHDVGAGGLQGIPGVLRGAFAIGVAASDDRDREWPSSSASCPRTGACNVFERSFAQKSLCG